LDARKLETGEVALIIAVTLDDEPAQMDSVAQQFQAMLRQFPIQAAKTFIMSSARFIKRHAGTEFYTRVAA
jgi:Tfp pilus assembly protein PilO